MLRIERMIVILPIHEIQHYAKYVGRRQHKPSPRFQGTCAAFQELSRVVQMFYQLSSYDRIEARVELEVLGVTYLDSEPNLLHAFDVSGIGVEAQDVDFWK